MEISFEQACQQVITKGTKKNLPKWKKKIVNALNKVIIPDLACIVADFVGRPNIEYFLCFETCWDGIEIEDEELYQEIETVFELPLYKNFISTCSNFQENDMRTYFKSSEWLNNVNYEIEKKLQRIYKYRCRDYVYDELPIIKQDYVETSKYAKRIAYITMYIQWLQSKIINTPMNSKWSLLYCFILQFDKQYKNLRNTLLYSDKLQLNSIKSMLQKVKNYVLNLNLNKFSKSKHLNHVLMKLAFNENIYIPAIHTYY
jgi:hypothetical protein